MTRLRKVDPEVLEREYIYDASTPPISFTGLAEKYGLARNTVAEKGLRGHWYERRKAFREQLGVKVVDALGDQWVRYETAVREKLMDGAVQYIDKWIEALKAGDVTVSTRDMLGVAAMLRAFLADSTAAKTNGEEVLFDPDTTDLHPDVAQRVLDVLDRPELAATAASSGPAEPGED
jgi:hypothetical protein